MKREYSRIFFYCSARHKHDDLDEVMHVRDKKALKFSSAISIADLDRVNKLGASAEDHSSLS